MAVTTIPVFPCRALDGVVPFYAAVGFDLAMRQERPNPYAAMSWRGGHLHIHGVRETSPTIALFIVDEVEELHASFVVALRALLGRLPTTGNGRITRMKPGQTRFTLVDPAGNSIYFIRRGEPDPHEETKRLSATLSPLGKAMRAAEVLRDFKTDPAAARKVLTTALTKYPTASADERAQAQAMLEDL